MQAQNENIEGNITQVVKLFIQFNGKFKSRIMKM